MLDLNRAMIQPHFNSQANENEEGNFGDCSGDGGY